MKSIITFVFLIVVLSFSFVPARAQASPVVQIVLFFNPECENCHLVMTKDLPPLQEKYGQQLEILQIDTSKPEGTHLYQAMSKHFQLSE